MLKSRANFDILAWRAFEERSKGVAEIVTQDVVTRGDIDEITAELSDNTNDNNPHEGNVASPVGILRDHASRVLPRTCKHFVF